VKLTPIVDLCHFGVPDWAGDFQNPEWPVLFGAYARAFATRFPRLRFYTPINEIFITARFSAELGWWNERLAGDRPFVTALKHLCQANLLAMRAILEVQPDAVFVQSESSEYFHAEDPSVEPLAHLLNQKRFLALDLTYGYPVRVGMYEYLLDNGMTREEYHWFARNQVKARCVMGNDYYVTNEHLVRSDGIVVGAGEIFGYYVITHQYYSRYHLPVMHTETNLGNPEAAPAWLRKQWANIQRLRLDGVPILGFTWYSLTDQVDWDTALREDNNRLVPCGLFDLDRRIRPVGEAYTRLIQQWRDVLPGQGMGVGPRW
jgi:beta-glucosidase/6-phospho-beta-glucosidase/beta-galactosidase